jgi:hypothetical protein
MIWGRGKNSNEDTANQDAFEVIFRPTGGFNKTGSFTEGNDGVEYERQGYLTLKLACKKLAYARTWGLEKDYDNKDDLADLSAETLSGKGIIKQSQWGRFSLSFLGSRRTHTTLDVSIRKGEEKHISVVPFKANNDLDQSWDEHFSIDVRLDEKTFGELRDELRANPAFLVMITAKLDGMRGLYTTWSPSISEGRILKFLDDKKDVSNQSDMPEEFHSVGVNDRLPFTISVGQFDNDEDEDHND